MSNSFDAELLIAYLESDYVHVASSQILKIGCLHPEMDTYFRRKNVDTYAWITAWNPYSRELSQASNIQRNKQLMDELKQYSYSKGYSQGISGDWREDGFWVENAIASEMINYCHEFEQNAFVFARRGQVLQLILA